MSVNSFRKRKQFFWMSSTVFNTVRKFPEYYNLQKLIWISRLEFLLSLVAKCIEKHKSLKNTKNTKIHCRRTFKTLQTSDCIFEPPFSFLERLKCLILTNVITWEFYSNKVSLFSLLAQLSFEQAVKENVMVETHYVCH